MHQEEDHFEVDDMKNKINDECELDAREEFLMSTIQSQNLKMIAICYAELLMVGFIVFAM